MITQRELNEINQLNNFFSNTEVFRAAISTDRTVHNTHNITECMKVIELYSYLYKHYDLIHDIFKTDSQGNIDGYKAHKIFNALLRDMCNRQSSPKQAIDELKRIRKSVDYTGELG